MGQEEPKAPMNDLTLRTAQAAKMLHDFFGCDVAFALVSFTESGEHSIVSSNHVDCTIMSKALEYASKVVGDKSNIQEEISPDDHRLKGN